MAKSSVEKLGGYAIKAGAVYLGFKMAQNGAFGAGLQQFAGQVQTALSGIAIAAPALPSVSVSPTSPSPPNQSNPTSPNPVPPVHQTSGGSHTLAQMQAVNPNFVSQWITWQTLRSQNGQDPTDWLAFDAYQIGIGAPDPGKNPPAEWPYAFGVAGSPSTN